jgi:pSer/pThr/pTyr-binding forkhead associated (FHA) protein
MTNLFLVRYPEKPVHISANGKVTVGRADTNSLVLTEPRVSRFHAQIDFLQQSQTYAVSDMGSSNGTYVNGHKLRPLDDAHQLANWDKIRMASCVFTARFVDDPEIIKREFKELGARVHLEATELIDVATLQSSAHQASISGDLEHLYAVELFQMFENARKTGILTLATDIGNGRFAFDNGQIIAAEFGSLVDDFAVFESLKISRGTFSFTSLREITEKQRITTVTTILLMEGCRLLDEANSGQS